MKPQKICPYTVKARYDENKKYFVDIFLNEEKIGEFERNYDGFGETTFSPFYQNNQWYALCSPIYVGLDIMSLPDCKIIGGEEKNAWGFCPVETFIPMYQWSYQLRTPEEELHKYPKENHKWLRRDRKSKDYGPNDHYSCGEWGVFDKKGKWIEDAPLHYENFAFVSGCIWGDDSSWKIELRDISEAHNGIIKKIDWGYHELPRNLLLKDAINIYNQDSYVDDWEERTFIHFSKVETFSLHDRKLR